MSVDGIVLWARFSFAPLGLVTSPVFVPRLAPWAAFFRRFAAGLSVRLKQTRGDAFIPIPPPGHAPQSRLVLNFPHVGTTFTHTALDSDWRRSILPLRAGRVFSGLPDAARGWNRRRDRRLWRPHRRGRS